MYTPISADVIAADLALAGVQPGAHLDAERLHGVADRHRAADRSLQAVEHREEARLPMCSPRGLETEQAAAAGIASNSRSYVPGGS
jgi:hypothetical protein